MPTRPRCASRNEYLRRKLEGATTASTQATLTAADWERSAATFGDLADSEAMDAAWLTFSPVTVACLIAISGLPGVGKTSVAEIVAARTGAVHLSIDAVEETILGCGLPPGRQVGVAAYEATRAMAELNLSLTRDVVLDAVNDSEQARQTWRAAAENAGADLAFVHLVMADAQEHERRLQSRDRGFSQVAEPTWADVQRRRAEYAAWADDVLEIDTSARTADEVADALLTALDSR